MDPRIKAIKEMHPFDIVTVGNYIVTNKVTTNGKPVIMTVGTGLSFTDPTVKVSDEFQVVAGILVFVPIKVVGIHHQSPEDFLEAGRPL